MCSAALTDHDGGHEAPSAARVYFSAVFKDK